MSAQALCKLQPCCSARASAPRHVVQQHAALAARPSLACRAGKKGFGSGDKQPGGGDKQPSSGSKQPGGGGKTGDMSDVIREQRQSQLAASDMLAKLLQAEDPLATATEHVDSLTESFFYTANTYLAMAHKEGNADVTAHIERALRAALEAKQATLRPEIRLLNRLLQAESPEQRQRLLFGEEETLTMNNRYFFGLLERMQKDVAGQPDNPQKAALVTRLAAIHQDSSAAVTGLP